ncbi:MAG: hypothetical protein ABIK26_08275, partial [Candidatus Omnitrophota bacterium]
RIKDKVERGGSREREREEKEKLQSRDRACPVLKIQKQEIDNQLKVFFKELKEIKAVIKDKGKRIKVKVEKGEEKSKKRSSLHAPRITKKGRKLKFRPEITRVKLNPEQAVLTCNCYVGAHHWYVTPAWTLAVEAVSGVCIVDGGKRLYDVRPFVRSDSVCVNYVEPADLSNSGS